MAVRHDRGNEQPCSRSKLIQAQDRGWRPTIFPQFRRHSVSRVYFKFGGLLRAILDSNNRLHAWSLNVTFA